MFQILKLNALLSFLTYIASSLSAAEEKLGTQLTKLEDGELNKAAKDSAKASAKQEKINKAEAKQIAKRAAKAAKASAKSATAQEKVTTNAGKRSAKRDNISANAAKAGNASRNFDRLFSAPSEPVLVTKNVIDTIGEGTDF